MALNKSSKYLVSIPLLKKQYNNKLLQLKIKKIPEKYSGFYLNLTDDQ